MSDFNSWDWWFGPWRALVRCTCGALAKTDRNCPICQRDWEPKTETVRDSSGTARTVYMAMMGAIDWSEYVLLKMMHVEWQRPAGHSNALSGLPEERRPSARLVVLILFWTLFERLMERLFADAMKELPSRVAADLLRRYAGIGLRLDRLFPLLFDTTFAAELERLGFPTIKTHLDRVQAARNAFLHGNPEAITDGLVLATAERLPEVQEAWIALYNSRCVQIRHT